MGKWRRKGPQRKGGKHGGQVGSFHCRPQDPEKLTAGEQAFVKAVIENPHLSNTVCYAISRGYKPEDATAGHSTNAAQAMRRPRVQKAIADARKVVEEKSREELAYGRVEVLRDLVTVKNECMKVVKLVNKKGDELGTKLVDAAGANRALELIGKELGMFVDRKEVRHGPLDGVTDDELDRIIEESATQAGVALRPAGEGSPTQH